MCQSEKRSIQTCDDMQLDSVNNRKKREGFYYICVIGNLYFQPTFTGTTLKKKSFFMNQAPIKLLKNHL